MTSVRYWINQPKRAPISGLPTKKQTRFHATLTDWSFWFFTAESNFNWNWGLSHLLHHMTVLTVRILNDGQETPRSLQSTNRSWVLKVAGFMRCIKEAPHSLSLGGHWETGSVSPSLESGLSLGTFEQQNAVESYWVTFILDLKRFATPNMPHGILSLRAQNTPIPCHCHAMKKPEPAIMIVRERERERPPLEQHWGARHEGKPFQIQPSESPQTPYNLKKPPAEPYQIHDSQIKGCCFKLLSCVVVCYTAIDDWNGRKIEKLFFHKLQ